MADDTTNPLPSATPPPEATPAQISHLRRSAAAAAIDEYVVVHGKLPPGCTLDDNDPEGTVTWLRHFQHSLSDDDARVARALCLSGGGIRSATFGLGVLQGLAKSGQLGHFHYLSSVSGGGYIASWLTSWIRRSTQEEVLRKLADSAVIGRYDALPLAHDAAAAAPASRLWGKIRRVFMTISSWLAPGAPVATPGTPATPEPEPPAISHLRAYSNYLSPAVGLSGDLMALVSIFLRNLFLHWTVLLPLLAALLMVPRVVLALLPLDDDLLPLWGLRSLTLVAVLAVVLAVAYMAADLPGEPPPPGRDPKNEFQLYNLLPLGIASLLFALLAPWLTTPASLDAVLLCPEPMCRGIPRVMDVPAGALVTWAALGAAAHLLGAFLGTWLWRRVRRKLPPRPNGRLLQNIASGAVVGLVGGGLLLVVLTKLASLWPAIRPGAAPATLESKAMWLDRYEAFVVLGPPLTLAVFWLTVTLFAGITRGLKSEEDREWWARAAGQWLLLALGWVGLAVVVLLLPRWLLTLPQAIGLPGGVTTLGVGTGLLGLLSSAIGYWSKNGQKLTGQIQSLVGRLGARALDLLSALFLLLLTALIGLALTTLLHALEHRADGLRKTLAAKQLEQVQKGASCLPLPKVPLPASCTPEPKLSKFQQSVADFRGTLHDSSAWTVVWVTGMLIVVGWLMAWFVGVNTFSLHSMYANRLTRAYLGASHAGRRPHWFTGFDPKDNPPLASPEPAKLAQPLAVAPTPLRLFPVINTALNLVQASGDRLEWQQRKAASFTFTPMHCGSPVLGYVETRKYSHGGGKGVSIGRAMAISGAAASPNMGYHSSTLVAIVMSLFNVRLGWWMPNTREESSNVWELAEPKWGLNTLLNETLASTSADRDFVYLSDGGHFENLGLYEMVRRRCRRIVVVDATADADFRHDDLHSAVRKIRIDLGISVEFPHGLPTAESVRRTGQPWALGRAVYRDIDPPDPAHPTRPVPDGRIVYLKPAMWDGLPLDVDGYAKSLPRKRSPFPHQTTGDQFFDESQFESYRMLGMLTALKAFGRGPWPTGNGPDHRTPHDTPNAADAVAANKTAMRSLRQRLAGNIPPF